MALIYSNFDFLEGKPKPWWRPDYDERNAQYFISETKRLQQAISLFVGEDENFRKDYNDSHREHYLIECISTEGNADINVVQQVLKKSWFDVFLSYIPFSPSRSSHLAKKVQNLRDTINYIFPTIFFPNLPIDHFTPSFAQQLHQQVGDGLIDDAGQYRRTKYVMPDDQETRPYLHPFLIKEKMKELFRQCREKFAKEELELEEAIKFGACFLAHFLYIHPFEDGNGRVAKLLLSYLLSRFILVPLTLHSKAKTRDLLIKCLCEVQWYNETPSALATFILEKIHLSVYNICVNLDIYPE